MQIYEYQRHIVRAQKSPTYANYNIKRVDIDNEDEFPIAAKAIHNKFYGDDLIISAETPEEHIKTFVQLQPLLSRHGYVIKKWIRNNDQVNGRMMEDLKLTSETNQVDVDPNEDEPFLLRLQDIFTDDCLQVCRGTTQRQILSLVS